MSIINPSPLQPGVERALKALSEAELRERVMPNLLRAMLFMEPRTTHGPQERGKDMLAWRINLLGTRDWHGFVLKVGDINAQVGHSRGIRTVLHQVEQTLDHPIPDPHNSSQHFVRECWVVTTGRILLHAHEDVMVTLRRLRLDQLVRWVDGTTLARLLHSHIDANALATMLDLNHDARLEPRR